MMEQDGALTSLDFRLARKKLFDLPFRTFTIAPATRRAFGTRSSVEE